MKGQTEATDRGDRGTGFVRGMVVDKRGSLILLLGLASLLWSTFLLIGYRTGLIEYGTLMAQGALAAGLGLITLLLAVFLAIRGRKTGHRLPLLRTVLGCVAAVLVLFYTGSWITARMTHPAIHDISTDLANPPRFAGLEVREDNFDAIPGADDGDMAGQTPRQRWAMIHQASYPDLRSVRVETPLDELHSKAIRLAQQRGWTISGGEDDARRLEMRGKATLLGLPHIVALRLRPDDAGAATIIDMRSLTEEGTSDFGINAGVIREFLSDLTGTTTTG